MKRHPRLRKAAKWGGLGLAAGSIALGVLGWVHPVQCYSGPEVFVWLRPGGVRAEYWKGTTEADRKEYMLAISHASYFDSPPPAVWSFYWFRPSADEWYARLPFWPAAALGLFAGVPAWLLDRRARPRVLAGYCPQCDYDRSTLPPATPCPECGAAGR